MENLCGCPPELDLVLRGGLPKHRVHLLEGDPGTGKTPTGLSFLIEGVKAGERDIDIFELVPVEALLTEQQTVLFSSEVELGETVNLITERITAISPVRVVTDSISKLRLLGRKCTTLLLDDLTTDGGGKDLHSVVQGVIALDIRERNYGAARRRLRIVHQSGPKAARLPCAGFAARVAGACRLARTTSPAL